MTVVGTRREAEAALARLIHDAETGGFTASAKGRVGEFLERWLRDSAAHKVAPKTLERYREIIEANVAPVIGGLALSKLAPGAIQDLYTRALATGLKNGRGGLSAQTVLHIHRVLHKALAQAVRWQLIARNPADAVDPPRPEKKAMKALTATEIASFLARIRQTELYTPALLATLTGLRRGELLGLKWEDVDLLQARLRVRSSLEQTKAGLRFKSPKTARSRRSVALARTAVEALAEHRSLQAERRLKLGPGFQPSGLVFPRPDGTPWPPATFSTRFAALVRSWGGPRFRFHDLRHTHATQLLLEGVHPKVVSERLGHSSIAITMDTYSHVLPGLQEDAAAKVDDALSAAIKQKEHG